MAKDIPKLEAELGELGGNICDLGNFLYSDTFDTLSLDERLLLIKQYEGMDTYYTALKARIKLG
tara:strand:+ start:619 stop:810 length:192 start_codon:yes stop_codon:yes gene_type:complete